MQATIQPSLYKSWSYRSLGELRLDVDVPVQPDDPSRRRRQGDVLNLVLNQAPVVLFTAEKKTRHLSKNVLRQKFKILLS